MIQTVRALRILPAVITAVLAGSGTGAARDSAPASSYLGKITGTVTSRVTGDPIAEAYVGVGDFGDSGGSNYSRHREHGLYDATKTDAAGRFELDGLAFTGPDGSHPVVVTHPRFVPLRQSVVVLAGKSVELALKLAPAGEIRVTVVDGNGEPVSGPLVLRLEALDGHSFIPPGRDQHLSAFAASSWPEYVRGGQFTFTELEEGDYAIDAVRFAAPRSWKGKPGYGGLVFDRSSTRFHGRVPSVVVKRGAETAVRITPENHETRLTLQLPEAPPGTKIPEVMRTPLVLVSRNPGLTVWFGGWAHSLEDARLGRAAKNALVLGLVPNAPAFTIENLPPGTYSLLAGPPVFLQGARFDLAAGGEKTIRIPWLEPKGYSRLPLWRLERRVTLAEKSYGVTELCAALNTALESRPEFRPDATLLDVEVQLTAQEPVIWDLVEKLCVERDWTVIEEGDNVLILAAR